LNYTFFAYYAGCYFYDAVSDSYSTAGCSVGKCSSPYATQCYCNHLTSFSNLFRLPEIKFDISSLNLNALNNSPGVMCFLVAIICLYLIVWIWARYADLQSEAKIGVVYLPGNDNADSYAYEITVWTGHMPGSGTSANVYMILAGDDCESNPRWLCGADPDHPAFQSGNVNMFLLTTSQWLGTLSHARLWHDNTGKHPSWYLLRILVRDIYTSTKYYFIANCWLSAEKDNGSVRSFNT
jgi:PLAT/LH2 domain/GPCR proteolysis site, GPS, motif